VRSGTGDDTTLFENDLNDILFVGRREDGIENLFRRTFEDTLGTLSGVEDVERVDNLYERDSTAREVKGKLSQFSVMCAITFVRESSSPVCYIEKKERDAESVQFDREWRECEGSREVEEWGGK